jgi:hypothetical protein
MIAGFVGDPRRLAQAEGTDSQAVDPLQAQAAVALLAGFAQALKRGDAVFIAAHTEADLEIQWVEYNMEAKILSAKLTTAREILRAKNRFELPKEFLAALQTKPLAVHVGKQRCDSSKPDKADFHKGPLALRASSKEVQVSFIAQPCDSQTHVTTWILSSSEQGLKLKAIRVRLGPS